VREKEVTERFDNLIDEMENIFENLNEEGARFLKEGDYEKAKKVMGKVREIKKIRDEAENLQTRWEGIFEKTSRGPLKRKKRDKKRKSYPRGIKTPEKDFVIPILEAIEELGGAGSVKEVLKKVFQKMEKRLNDYDFKSIPSHPDRFRWENTAMWCRQSLVDDGFLSPEAKRGLWVLTEKGKARLEQERKKQEAPSLFDENK